MKAEKTNVPQSGFTQRATIDCERDEIYVLSVSIQSILQRNFENVLKFFSLSIRRKTEFK